MADDQVWPRIGDQQETSKAWQSDGNLDGARLGGEGPRSADDPSGAEAAGIAMEKSSAADSTYFEDAAHAERTDSIEAAGFAAEDPGNVDGAGFAGEDTYHEGPGDAEPNQLRRRERRAGRQTGVCRGR